MIPVGKRRRGGSSRGRSSVVKNNIWSVLLENEILIAAGATFVSPIVTQIDWAPLGAERATILTVRGWMSICANNDDSAKSEGQVFWYIGLVSGLETPLLADSGTTYAATNILDTGGHIFENVAATTSIGQMRPTKDWDINIKTMRTIMARQDLVVVVTNGTGDDIRFGGLFRALLRKGGN